MLTCPTATASLKTNGIEAVVEDKGGYTAILLVILGAVIPPESGTYEFDWPTVV